MDSDRVLAAFDASPDSQPILARLGFSRLALTTPYVWDPRHVEELTAE